ncbi:hypothetical protein CsSME_00026825 [Camellia sinensis var. sinensis]
MALISFSLALTLVLSSLIMGPQMTTPVWAELPAASSCFL